MFKWLKRKRRMILFSIRPQLRAIHQAMDKAYDDVDVAIIEELEEERRQLIYAALSGKREL